MLWVFRGINEKRNGSLILLYVKKRKKLGYFTDFDEAVKVRKKAEEKYFGEYSYDNSMKEGVV